MKKIINLIIALLFCSILNAQTEQGKIIVGMSTTLSSIGTGPEMFGVGFSINKTKVGSEEADPIKNIGINIVPQVGYFIIDNLAVGIDANYSYSSMEIKNLEESQTKNFGGIGCFGRYYTFNSKIHPFIEIDTGLGKASIKHKTPDISSNDKSFFYNIGIGAGVAIPIGGKVTFNLIAGYDYIKELPEKKFIGQKVESVIHSVGFDIGFMVTL